MADADGAKILTWAKSKQLTTVGSGECFDLADQAIKDQGAKSADAYGTVGPNIDYTWGTAITIGGASPGDILQYKDYVCTITLDNSYSIDFGENAGGVDWGDVDTSQSYKRPHHTAIVASGVKDNQVSVIEQNVERGGSTKVKKVDMGSNYVSDPDDVTTTSTKQVTINTAWAATAKGKTPTAAAAKAIDAALAKYNGQTFTAKVTTVKSVAVTGTINAYRVQK